MTSKEEGFAIKIKTFINPHLFYFQLENACGQSSTENDEIIEKKAETCDQIAGYQANVGEMVLAYIQEWSKWIRAEVDSILISGKEYVIWCTDHGVPLKCSIQNIKPIPMELQRLPVSVYRGGLAKCVPIEKRLNFGTKQFEIAKTDDFDEILINGLTRFIEDSAEIFFTPLQKIDDHIFGDVLVIKYDGTKVYLRKRLVKSENAQEDIQIIPNGIENWKTVNKSRYEKYLRQLNIMNPLGYPSILKKQSVSAMSVFSSQMDQDNRMILDWTRQNKEKAKITQQDIKQQFDQLLNTLDSYNAMGRVPRHSCRMLYNLGSCSSVQHSNDDLARFDSRSTLAEQSIAYVEVASQQTRSQDMLTKRMNRLTTNTKPAATKKPTTASNNMVFIPSGYERDILEFHKYN